MQQSVLMQQSVSVVLDVLDIEEARAYDDAEAHAEDPTRPLSPGPAPPPPRTRTHPGSSSTRRSRSRSRTRAGWRR